jgi:hypothetical protein
MVSYRSKYNLSSCLIVYFLQCIPHFPDVHGCFQCLFFGVTTIRIYLMPCMPKIYTVTSLLVGRVASVVISTKCYL